MSEPANDSPREKSVERVRSSVLNEAIGSTVQEPLLILLGDLTVESANRAFYDKFKVDEEQTVRRSVFELGNGQWNIPELQHLLNSVLSTGGTISGYRVDHEFDSIGRRVLLLNAHRVDWPKPAASIVLTFRDNTEIEFLKEYSEKIVDALRDPFLVLDWDLRVKSANRPFYDNFRVEPGQTEGRFIYELGNGQWNIPRLRELLEDVLPRNSTFDDFEVEHDFEQIGTRVMLLNARRIDHLKLILLVIADVTEAKHADRRQKVLLGELQHRVNNLLMNVRALFQLTARGASSLDSFSASFNARLDAMARTQDLLVRGPEDAARLEEIIRLELKAIGARQGSNFRLEGPEALLSPRAAHAFAMTIHELTTNAAKYGALSSKAANGCIVIEWSAEPLRGADTRLRFRWREYGLSISPRQERTGFGTQVVETSLPYLFGGSSTLTFNEDGLECVIEGRFPSRDLRIPRAQQP